MDAVRYNNGIEVITVDPVERAVEILRRLPSEKVHAAIYFLELLALKDATEVGHQNETDPQTTAAPHRGGVLPWEDDQVWLDADLSELPPYDWGADGPPAGRPVRYVPGKGLIITEGDETR